MTNLDRQAISDMLLRNSDEQRIEFSTATGTLKAFSLTTEEMGGAIFGEHRPRQLSTQRWLELQPELLEWRQLGDLYLSQGKLAEGETMFERALIGSEKTLSPDHMLTLDTVHCLGDLYSNWDRLAEAEATHKRALSGTEMALGPDHESTLDTVHGQHLLATR
ncbi:MAG: hypothetical protein M1839_002835 [Geoglossum umbratile]|nr:MAG: hypothetical protein M1839_002835 [Geoglossum umbratile]